MKILVATKESNGGCPGDFCFTDEGEIVFPSDCDHEGEECGCRRSVVGARSGKGTTTMMVVEADLTREQFRDAIVKANKDFIKLGIPPSVFHAQADDLLRLAAELPAGVVIERDGDDFHPRPLSGLAAD